MPASKAAAAAPGRGAQARDGGAGVLDLMAAGSFGSGRSSSPSSS
jgi:hypothetical protein